MTRAPRSAHITGELGRPLSSSERSLASRRIGNGGAFIRTVEGRRVKRCAGCKLDKPLDAFSLGTGPGGLHRHCRACCREWRIAHQERQP